MQKTRLKIRKQRGKGMPKLALQEFLLNSGALCSPTLQSA